MDVSAKGDGKTDYFVAPEDFTGDWAGVATLCLELRSQGGSYYTKPSYGAKGDVVLTLGDGGTVALEVPRRPEPEFELFCFDLRDLPARLADELLAD